MSRINEAFDGKTFNAERDEKRLNVQLDDVRSYMIRNPGFSTLAEIAAATGHPQASVSARLRDLRKTKFGGYLINRKARSKGLYEYQLDYPKASKPPVSGKPSVVAALATGLIVSALAWSMLLGRAMGGWEGQDPVIKRWFETLMQPDNPETSCCGFADAYWADDVSVEDGKVIASITDTRPDGPLNNRRHIPPGTRFVVPNHKLKYDRGNPTGHTVIFINSYNDVLCFVQSSGT